MYLTYEEFTALGYTDVTEEQFPMLLRKASNHLNYLTRDFYAFTDLETDGAYRRKRFKEALAAQIHYYQQRGSTDAFALQNSSSSVTIGRTSIGSSTGGTANQNQNQRTSTSETPAEVFQLLTYTGLLYRGVSGC